MTILVAGGAGYIGSHVCKMLAKEGFDVLVYDNLSKGYKTFVKWGKFIEGDIGDRKKLEEVFESNKIEAVMHFCGFIEVGESVNNPHKYYINNVVNTLYLLEIMLKHKVNNFIFSSSAAVYGMPEKIPIDETAPTFPINPYGKTKLMVENILDDYHNAYGLNSVCFRYFNAAGADPDGEIGEAHNPETHLIPLVLDAAMGRRDSVKIYGTDYDTKDGTCIRDYIHVNDLAKAHILGLKYLFETKSSEKFNLGSESGYSVREIIETVKKITNKDFNVIETERRPGDPAILVAKSDKAKKILGWNVEYSIEDIVKTAWKWHTSRLKPY